ncbi:hypothetical protein SAMN04489760_12219 [Syntrophus gentianae]|uniref:Uncharacterized protein n=1 Tax=Syntrophus gentianae TaxID=43775 RepID=A0A1H7ZCJ6_9BACT|nr:hypothetical protein [Syntrophus gentianae]SEM55951.1 hypothetical protein SAMN04489760_12219 [Syntrophus gentianae]
MKVVVMATRGDGDQERTLDADRIFGTALGSLDGDIKETLDGSPREDVLLVFVDGGKDKLQEMALYIKERLETQKGDEADSITDDFHDPWQAGKYKN